MALQVLRESLGTTQLCLSHRWGDGDPHGLEDLATYSLQRGAKEVTLPLVTDLHLLQRFQVTQDVRPFQVVPTLLKPLLKLVHQQQGKETAEDVPGDRRVHLVEDRPSLQETLSATEESLHSEEVLVLLGHLGGRQLGQIQRFSSAKPVITSLDPAICSIHCRTPTLVMIGQFR